MNNVQEDVLEVIKKCFYINIAGNNNEIALYRYNYSQVGCKKDLNFHLISIKIS